MSRAVEDEALIANMRALGVALKGSARLADQTRAHVVVAATRRLEELTNPALALRTGCAHEFLPTGNWLIDRCTKCGEERA